MSTRLRTLVIVGALLAVAVTLSAATVRGLFSPTLAQVQAIVCKVDSALKMVLAVEDATLHTQRQLERHLHWARVRSARLRRLEKAPSRSDRERIAELERQAASTELALRQLAAACSR